MGVAGGLVLGSVLADMLTPDAAMAGDAPEDASKDAFGGEGDAGFAEMQELIEAPDTGDLGDELGSDV